MNAPDPRYIGRRVRRVEDPALLRGEGTYLDDIRIPGLLHAAFVRSPHAHATIKAIDCGAARAMPGIVAVFCASDLARSLNDVRLPLHFPPGKLEADAMPFVLAPSEVCHVGEAVALVVATSRYLAEDAADRVEADYDVLAAAVDARDALSADAPRSRNGTQTNVFTTIKVDYGDCAREFAAAAHVLREKFFQHRGVAHPIEGRGVLVSIDPGSGALSVWSSTQVTHELRSNIVEMMDLRQDEVRVIPCDVGGGFGCKFMVYPEEVAVAAAARLLGRPVKWIEDRREHFLCAIQERDQFWDVEAAVDRDGRLRGVRGQLIHDQGAYAPHAITVPYNSASSLVGAYMLPAYQLDVHVVRTNKPPVIPIRGAGYQQGTFVMERLLDGVAGLLGIDRAEIRRRNLIPAKRMPYRIGLANRAGKPVVYDSGDYEACQDLGLRAADYAGFPARQAAALKQGRHIGIGCAHGVKCTGRGPFESATIRVSTTGQVTVYTGATAIGQGTQTTLAQICADTLGVNIADVRVICGDTAFVQYGLGSFGSRQTMIAGSSVEMAARVVRDKALAVARQMLGAELGPPLTNAEKELFVADGKVQVTDRPDLAIPLARIAHALRGAAGYAFPLGVEVGLEATQYFRTDEMAYANGFHVCEAEVDTETGHVTILRYIAVQDSGKIVNPLTSEGQVCGGVVHGIGNALLEWMRYSEDGQPITTTFADYLLPTATDVPNIECIFHETLSPLNPMGMKGVGEVSIVPVPAVIASAVENALSPFSIRIRDVPITPIRLLELIERAQAGEAAEVPELIEA
ncbi:MAG: xanthine dehydrogenase family protein molybdopterin-binding subunit [Parvibaculaceae bacterium]